jgi:hypothetical protein
VGERGACRLCLGQARILLEPGRAPDLAGANRYGRQLFFANMRFQRPRTPRLKPEPRPIASMEFAPLAWQQLPLFELQPDPEVIKERALAADNVLLRYCKGRRPRPRREVRVEQEAAERRHPFPPAPAGPAGHPGAKIRATDVLQLPRYGGSISSALDILAAAGLLIDDRPSHIERYFAGKTASLPAPMKAQLETWLNVMLNGSTTAPRQRRRDPQTARIHILGIAPIVQAWAAAGYESLAEITTEHVIAALPKSRSHRNWAEFGLRSLFGVLKARKLVFIDPTRGMSVTPVNESVPLPLDTEAIRQGLNSPDPSIALAVAMVAFHALMR